MALLALLKLSCSIGSMIDGLKENIFIVTDQMLIDLLLLSLSRGSHFYYIQNVKIDQSNHGKRDEQL